MKGSRVLLDGKKLVLVTMLGLNALSSISAQAAAWNWNDTRDFIIGGVSVPIEDVIASTTVAIVSQQPGGGMALCTGSIIDTDLIVTAGHCVGPSPSKMLVVFRQNLSDKSGPVVHVTGYVQDPDYGQGQNDQDMDDIAVIRFAGGLPAGYQAATLLDDSSALQDGETITLAGFGITNGDPATRDAGDDGAGTLRKVDTTILHAQYGQTEVLVDQSQGKGACHGDSGGPAFVKNADGSLSLFGVTSRGPSNAVDNCATAGIYTNILAHTDFIAAATDELRSGGSD